MFPFLDESREIVVMGRWGGLGIQSERSRHCSCQRCICRSQNTRGSLVTCRVKTEGKDWTGLDLAGEWIIFNFDCIHERRDPWHNPNSPLDTIAEPHSHSPRRLKICGTSMATSQFLTAANAMQKYIKLNSNLPNATTWIWSIQSVGKDIGTSSEELVRDR